jgi:hypothetical protein
MLVFEVNDMPEHKILDRKTEEEKLRKGPQNDTMESEPGNASKQSNFMEEERQGLQGDRARAKQLYEEKKGNLSQTMKEGVEPPLRDVQPGKTFEKDVEKGSSCDTKKERSDKEGGWKDKPIQGRSEESSRSPEEEKNEMKDPKKDMEENNEDSGNGSKKRKSQP